MDSIRYSWCSHLYDALPINTPADIASTVNSPVWCIPHLYDALHQVFLCDGIFTADNLLQNSRQNQLMTHTTTPPADDVIQLIVSCISKSRFKFTKTNVNIQWQHSWQWQLKPFHISLSRWEVNMMSGQHRGVCSNDNNNIQDNVYGAVIMAEPLREFIRFIW